MKVLTVLEKISKILMKYLLLVGVSTYLAWKIEVNFWINVDTKDKERLNNDKELTEKLTKVEIEETIP